MGRWSKQIKWNTFTDLQRACLCCISYCKCNLDSCEELYLFALTGRSRALISLAFAVLWCLCRQMGGRERGANSLFFGACSERHTLNTHLMVLQRRAQFCSDCLRMGSSGQLALLRNQENWVIKAETSFFTKRSGRGEGTEQKIECAGATKQHKKE